MDMKENGKWGGEEGIMLQGLTVTESIVQCMVIGRWELAELADGGLLGVVQWLGTSE